MNENTSTLPSPGWWIFTGSGQPHDGIAQLPDPPGWRVFPGEVKTERTLPEEPNIGRRFGRARSERPLQLSPLTIEAVNAALYLRRPLLITGKPGTGKSSLAYAVAHELKLGTVLTWAITSRSTLQQGLYQYDAIGRLNDARPADGKPPNIGPYLRLGPLGTALVPSFRPRVLLIDEIDKSDLDLPNDLLNVFEEGMFRIPELERLADTSRIVKVRPSDSTELDDTVEVVDGRVICRAFPFVVLTNNGERDFPPPFLRRCLRLEIPMPDRAELAAIVAGHLGESTKAQADALIDDFLKRLKGGDLAMDQLLNAVFLVTREHGPYGGDKDRLMDALMQPLNSAELK